MQIRESGFADQIGKYKNTLYFCHRNADPDAIGSGFALQQAFGGSLGAAEDLSRLGQVVARAIEAEVTLNPRIEDFDLVVVVDTSVGLQLGDVRLSRYAVVDHHLDRGLLAGAEFYIQRPANSTAEIVWKILRESDKAVSRNAALGLLAGIISDTGRFRRGSPESFQAAAEILAAGEIDYGEALTIFFSPTDLSQRIAVLKAASRAEIQHNGNWIFATTEINAFEGQSAMALVEMGADVAFVAGRHNDLTRISGRASRDAVRASLNLAEILRDVAQAHGGEGGGHKAAAALEARAVPGALLEACRKKALECLKSR